MGLTGFNLARREEEEAAASAAASVSTDASEVCPMPEQKEAPKRGRKKVDEES